VGKDLIGLQFQVKTKDGTIKIVREVADYTSYQLLSDVGGQLGLWVGMSVMTVLDLASLVGGVIKVLCQRSFIQRLKMKSANGRPSVVSEQKFEIISCTS
jgi:hypothetical protein